MVKAYLIDSKAQTVEEVNYSTWHDIAPLLGCDYFDVVRIQKDHIIYVDDEGLLKTVENGFIWDGQELAGNGLIVGSTPDGADTDCTLHIEEIQKHISFFEILYLPT